MNTFALNTLQKKIDRLHKSKEEDLIDLSETKERIIELQDSLQKTEEAISDLVDAIKLLESAYA